MICSPGLDVCFVLLSLVMAGHACAWVHTPGSRLVGDFPCRAVPNGVLDALMCCQSHSLTAEASTWPALVAVVGALGPLVVC